MLNRWSDVLDIRQRFRMNRRPRYNPILKHPSLSMLANTPPPLPPELAQAPPAAARQRSGVWRSCSPPRSTTRARNRATDARQRIQAQALTSHIATLTAAGVAANDTGSLNRTLEAFDSFPHIQRLIVTDRQDQVLCRSQSHALRHTRTR